MIVAVGHGSDGGRVRVRDGVVHVRRPLADWRGSRRNGFAAGGRQQPVDDGRPKAGMEPDHFVGRMRSGVNKSGLEGGPGGGREGGNIHPLAEPSESECAVSV